MDIVPLVVKMTALGLMVEVNIDALFDRNLLWSETGDTKGVTDGGQLVTVSIFFDSRPKFLVS